MMAHIDSLVWLGLAVSLGSLALAVAGWTADVIAQVARKWREGR